MKKILALAALGVFALVAVAQSGPLVAPHLVHQKLRFVTHSTAITAATVGAYKDYLYNSTNDAPYAVDSLTATKAAAASFDTTVAISTAGWVPQYSTGLADSTANACVLTIANLSGSSSSADSIYIQAQVSNDGANWSQVAACLGTPVDAAYLLNTTANGTVRAYTPIGGTSAASNQFMTNYKVSTQFVAGVNPTVFNFTNWPLIRFIFKGTDTYKQTISATLTYVSAQEDLNQ